MISERSEHGPRGPRREPGRGRGPRYFVKVQVPDRRQVRGLAALDLDLHAVRDQADGASVDGLMTLDQVRKVIRAGFPVLIEAEADERAHGRNVIEFDAWLAAQERDLGPLGEG
jgi:hypothetical protein